MPNRNLGGRPPKYNEPSRPVTVTLPESVLLQLERISSDRGQAIVKLVNRFAGEMRLNQPVEIVDVGRKSGLIVVGSCPALERVPFLHLVEVAPARFLLAIERKQDFSSLEIAIHDLLDDASSLSQSEREFIGELLATISRLRKSDRVSHAEILLVDMQSGGDSAPGGKDT